MKKIAILSSLFILSALLSLPASLSGQETVESPQFSSEVVAPPTDQIIISFAPETAASQLLAVAGNGTLSELEAAAGISLQYLRPMGADYHVLKLPQRLPVREVATIANRLTQVEGVAEAEPDRILSLLTDSSPAAPNLIPNDTLWNQMWHLHYTPNTSEGINAAAAWNISTGSASTVVAVLDTGILVHNDLAGRTVPGYDFIHDPWTANDGDGRDPNPADPGDWVSANACGFSHPAQSSSWHGTHVAGTIGAATNNGVGIAGVNWQAKILPVRVLGRCGGYTSDIIDGMRWAAGLSVSGVPANANPAKVLNLSLGGPGSCSSAQQTAINQIVAAGSVIVVAAGNSNQNVSGFNPANCSNVIAVAATNRTGNRAFYSNYGSLVKISAPGGETSSVAGNGVLSTLDSGTTTPNNSHTYTFYQGTSMAAPHVAGVASLILGLRPTYTPAQVLSLLQTTARPFPAGSSCNTTNCGTGIVDAYRALNALTTAPSAWVYLPLVNKPAAPPPPPPPPSPIVNPSFEQGTTGWVEYSSNGWDIIINSGYPSGVTPRTGSWLAWLGGDYDDISFVQQQVVVPASAPYLTYWHWIASADICGYDFGGLLINGVVVDVYTLCQATSTGGWVPRSVNLSTYAGQTVVFQVRVETDGSLNSNMFVDDFSFGASPATGFTPAGESAAVDTAARTVRSRP
jgi:serine protease